MLNWLAAFLTMITPLILDGEAPSKGSGPVDFDLVTAQAGITTGGNVKDRVIVRSNINEAIRYNGLYEGFQNDHSFLDDLYFRNEILATGAGSDHCTPMSVIKLGEKDDRLYLKDLKVGISNTSIPEKLLGNGKVYLTANTKEVTGFFYHAMNLPDNILGEITAEATFSPGRKPFMYIEGELQKRFGSGLYLFTRGEVDNQGSENKIIFGIGYTP